MFFVLGCFLTPMSVSRLLSARDSVNWPVVQGSIFQSQVEDGEWKSRSQGTKPYYQPKVAYSYEVNGTRFQGTKVSFTEHAGTTDPTWAKGIVSRYPMGKRVTVFYKPNDPGFAIL